MADLTQLRRALREARSFQAAAGALLDHGQSVLAGAFEGALVARGLVHLRSERAGYLGVVHREWTQRPSAADIAPSASAFALVEHEKAAVGIDVRAVRGERLSDGSTVDVTRALPVGDPKASVHQVIARGATHVIALPLFAAAGEIVGMATFEAI